MPIDTLIKPFAELTIAEIAARLQQGEIHGAWPDGWWHDRRVFAAHHQIWREAIAATPSCPTGSSGRRGAVAGI